MVLALNEWMSKKPKPGSRSDTSPREVELKFAGDEGAIANVQQSKLIARWAEKAADVHQLKSTYYDMPDHALRTAGYTLRLRDKGGGLCSNAQEHCCKYQVKHISF